MSAARDYALLQLDRLSLPGWRANLIRRKLLPPTDSRDLALAEQIRVGVIKNHLLLNHLIDQYASHPGKIDPLVRKILAVALYQLRFLQRIPESAAVDEAVEQARRFGRSKAAAGFINALLRHAIRESLPDPREPWIRLSHPRELYHRLVALLGEQRATQFCEHDNREPPTIVRTFRDAKLPDDLRLIPHEQPSMFVIEGAKRADFARLAAGGLAQVQDPTAAGVAEHLDVHPGHDVLDRCAGMGTKTLQLHDLTKDKSWIMAVDQSAHRCDALQELVAQRKLENIAVVQASMLWQIPELKRPAFDRILLDAPCSNSGVLARRPEARYAQSARHIASLVKLQDQILADTAPYLRDGGLLVYSTCSVWPEENEQRARQFLDNHPDYQQLYSQTTWPSMDHPNPQCYHDGGFLAVLARK